MQPESVTPGFKAAAHRRGGRQSEVHLGARDLRRERLQCSHGHLASERWLIHSARHREDPVGVAELEGEI
jgi:hypothetical protein